MTILSLTNCFKRKDIKHRTDIIKSEFNVESKAQSTFYTLTAKSIDGAEVAFSQFKGKKVIILNVASNCGYTPQYAHWEKFYNENKDKVVVLGFPCNQFLGQEPGSNEEIQSFCQKNYGVTFQLFDKIDVKGKDQSEIYQWLTDKSKNGWNTQEPSWNFCKYLINEQGELMEFFASAIKPDDKAFIIAVSK